MSLVGQWLRDTGRTHTLTVLLAETGYDGRERTDYVFSKYVLFVDLSSLLKPEDAIQKLWGDNVIENIENKPLLEVNL